MRKDKEWLKEKIQRIATKLSLDDRLTGDIEDDIAEVVEAVDQLEEPEITEEQAWKVIAKEINISAGEAQEIFNGNYRKKLFEELEKESEIVNRYKDVVKKQTEEIIKLREQESKKPVIPQFVADWIEERKKIADHWFEAWDELADDYFKDKTSKAENEIYYWLVENPDKYVDAYRHGYSVAKEKLYTVSFKQTENKGFYLYKLGGAVHMSADIKGFYTSPSLHQLTEKEIKDYDERMWAFAEEVTE